MGADAEILFSGIEEEAARSTIAMVVAEIDRLEADGIIADSLTEWFQVDWHRDIVDAWVWRRPFTEEEEREVRRMKARVERERIPPGEDPDFHLKLGRGSLSDVEWTVQLLQLQHQVPEPSTLPALAALEASLQLRDPQRRHALRRDTRAAAGSSTSPRARRPRPRSPRRGSRSWPA